MRGDSPGPCFGDSPGTAGGRWGGLFVPEEERCAAGEAVVRRDVHHSGRVWSEQALRVVADGAEALVTACAPGGELRRPWRYVRGLCRR
ncbi:hypothetical protein ACWEOV_36695 [Streptomyces sp. NPDC004365]